MTLLRFAKNLNTFFACFLGKTLNTPFNCFVVFVVYIDCLDENLCCLECFLFSDGICRLKDLNMEEIK